MAESIALPVEGIDHEWGLSDLPDKNGCQKLRALDPRAEDDSQFDVYLRIEDWNRAAEEDWSSHELAHTVRMVLSQPQAVFLGFRQGHKQIEESPSPDFTKGFVYILRPEQRYIEVPGPPGQKDGTTTEPPGNHTFCVFVKANRMILSWGWFRLDVNDECLPIDCDERFSRRVR